MEQTAVEWLIKRYHDYGTLYYEDMTKAKEMEKEQIKEAYCKGDDNVGAEQYYNETYNK